jgi:hypothetical protein
MKTGAKLGGLQIFNVPLGKEGYVEGGLAIKAKEVAKLAGKCIENMQDDHPQELSTKL